ncbi:MAG TPA: response regulator [Pyrinomonadaceae bacterium]|nr:response regulator [Pyrinomonadaceae bacterium]
MPHTTNTFQNPLAARDRKPLVLVIEDHEDTRSLLRYMIEANDCSVIEAEDGEQGVNMAELMVPDLILMDTSLPRLDGLEATRRIRRLAGTERVPIIFISGFTHPESRAEALATGGNDYLVKPLDLNDLDAAVKKQLAKDSQLFRTASPAS